jgi:hypothetical protein
MDAILRRFWRSQRAKPPEIVSDSSDSEEGSGTTAAPCTSNEYDTFGGNGGPRNPGPALRIGSAPFGDGNRGGTRDLEHRRLFPVVRAPAQVVQMRHRDSRPRPKLRLAELLVLALQDAQRGRSAQSLVRATSAISRSVYLRGNRRRLEGRKVTWPVLLYFRMSRVTLECSAR